jgi:DNA polymerase-4
MRQKEHANISKAEIFTEQKFNALCMELFEKTDKHRRLHIIRLSISCSSFTQHSKKELSLLGFYEDMPQHSLTCSTQKLREKYGLDILKYASEL